LLTNDTSKGYDLMMKVYPEQLQDYLQKQKNMPPVFLISGDEPLQMMEAADQIRQSVKAAGFTERDIINADAQYDWRSLQGTSNSLSLFSEKTLIDLTVVTKSPGNSGSTALRDYMKNPPRDKVLLIQTAKLAGNARNSAWVKAIEKVGAHMQVWELSLAQTMAWVSKRMRAQGMRPTGDAVRLLTERVEGNLLAALQEINKLSLLQKSDINENVIDEEQVLAAVSDSSRYSIFDFSNAVMMGDARRIQHIHHNLKEEGVPIQLILWTLSDLSRQLYNASFNLRGGMPTSQIISKMPRPRQKPFQIALQRMQNADWPTIFDKNSQIDHLSKGQGEFANKGLGRVWSNLLELALILAGTQIIKPAKLII